MKKITSNTLATIFFILAAACNVGTTSSKTDSSEVPSAMDTMPVLHPGNFDSSGTIKTPPTNDNNVINPDTTSIQSQ